MASTADVITTEISVVGANCPWCFNATADALRAESGVIAVNGTIGGQCLRVDHADVATDRLLSIVHQHLHAHDISSSEQVMVEVDVRAAELHCTHAQQSAPTSAGRPDRV